VSELLAAGADPNKCTTDDNTAPIHVPAMYGLVGVVRLLLAASQPFVVPRAVSTLCSPPRLRFSDMDGRTNQLFHSANT
jgi:hypothetical protein